MCTWKDHPYNRNSAITGTSSLDCEAVESLDLASADAPDGTIRGYPSASSVVRALLLQPGPPLQGGLLLICAV